MTTKLDLFRDRLKELIIDFDFQIDTSDDGDGDLESMPEWKIEELVDDMSSMIDDYDEEATNQNFTIEVTVDKFTKD